MEDRYADENLGAIKIVIVNTGFNINDTVSLSCVAIVTIPRVFLLLTHCCAHDLSMILWCIFLLTRDAGHADEFDLL